MLIRPATSADGPVLYDVCVRTGADGEDATGAYRDTRLLGHIYVGPYLALEPDLAFVLDDGAPAGYVLGARDTRDFDRRCEHEWWPPLRKRYANPTMSGCWSLSGLPIVQGDDVLSVLPGTMGEGEMSRRLADTQAAVIMKVGRNLPKIRRALSASGRLVEAIYVERGTMPESRAVRLSEKLDDSAPYFSLVLVPGWSGRS